MRALIVDDSEIDRVNLQGLLEDHEGIEVVGEAYSVETAVELIRAKKPDLLFLDLHLNKDKGFSVLDQIEEQPLVIITTAHPNYALKGFEINAVDYVLKPMMEENLARAVARLSLSRNSSGQGKLYLDDFQLFKSTDGFDAVKVENIQLIKGERIYTMVYASNGSHYLHRYKMREWRNLLSDKTFVAVDRSSIINISAIRRVVENEKGGFDISFVCEEIPPLSIGQAGMKTLRQAM